MQDLPGLAVDPRVTRPVGIVYERRGEVETELLRVGKILAADLVQQDLARIAAAHGGKRDTRHDAATRADDVDAGVDELLRALLGRDAARAALNGLAGLIDHHVVG